MPPLSATLNLVSQAVIVAVLLFGFYSIRRKNVDRHRRSMTTAVVLSLLALPWWMGRRWLEILPTAAVEPTAPEIGYPLLHGVGGGLTLLLASYLVIRMRFRLPRRLRVKNFKRWMRITLAAWLLVALGGAFNYLVLWR